MQHYKKLMALTVGLLLAILSGAVSSEFVQSSDWFLALPLPKFFPPSWCFQTAWLVVYVVTAFLVADTVATVELRKNLIGWIILSLLQPLWCFVFFRLHFLVVSLVLLVVIFLLQLLILAKMLPYKKWEPFLALPIVMWYMFLITIIYSTLLAF